MSEGSMGQEFIPYIVAQLGRALASPGAAADAEARARAEAKLVDWSRVLAGTLSGSLEVGSRTPTGAPPWVTLEVLRGGFASGVYAAEGPLLPHELERLGRLGRPADARARAVLNASYLDEAGIAELQALLDGGGYRIDVPEEAALLAVAWLARADRPAQAAAILEAIAPWMDRLRFYPRPAERPLEVSARVRRQPIAETIAGLEARTTPAQLGTMNAALAVWGPLTDRAVALVLETVEGPAPSCAEDGTVVGGWPYHHVGAEWRARAQALLADYATLASTHPRGKRHERPGESLFELRWSMQRVLDGLGVSQRHAAQVRSILAHIARKRGLPGSSRLETLRDTQRVQAALPLHAASRREVIERLRRFPQDGGLSSLDGLVDGIEGRLRPKLEAALLRSLEAPVDELVSRGALPSPETLAEVTPQLAAFVKTAAMPDAALRRLYGATYLAFRARRSLLLLDLAHQVRLEELPWAAALEAHRGAALDVREHMLETLRSLTTLVLDNFPHVLLPNALITDLAALAAGAKLDVPWVNEIAVDIFTGALVDKFRRAAVIAAGLLRGTVYERYYDARFAEVMALPAGDASAFGALCQRRAGPRGTERSTVYNGRVLEQAQILTTHNLAALVTALWLRPSMRSRFPELAQACFSWILARAPRVSRANRHTQLITRKNSAYAWRQMVFFLAASDEPAQLQFAAWMGEALAKAPAEVRVLWSPKVLGLDAVLRGRTIEETPGAVRCLGWSA
jgi:hypothetical protein